MKSNDDIEDVLDFAVKVRPLGRVHHSIQMNYMEVLEYGEPEV